MDTVGGSGVEGNIHVLPFQQADCAKNKTDPMPFENSYNLFFSTFARLIFITNRFGERRIK